MSLRKDFYALPFRYRVFILFACIGFSVLCGALVGALDGSGLAVGVASGCGGVLLYHVLLRVVLMVFVHGAVKTLKPVSEEAARKREETERGRVAAKFAAQVARAQALVAAREARGAGARVGSGEQKKASVTPDAPREYARGGPRAGLGRRPFGRRPRRRPSPDARDR